MKISEILKEGDVVTLNTPHTGNTNKTEPEIDMDKTEPKFLSQDEVDDLTHEYRNLGVGSLILYKNKLAQIIAMPDADRLIIKFDENGEKKIVGKKDENIDLVPKEHLPTH